jgi:hypothetical protein
MATLMNRDARNESGKSTPRRDRVRSRLVLWYLSALIATGFCIGTGLINGWGSWYSSSMPYRRQTEALLDGRMALSTSPLDLDRDMVWYGGRVQQVWGLGVPCWRLLFEAPARWLGQPAFPDRIAFAIALCLLTYAVLRRFIFANDRLVDWKQEPHLLLAVFLTVLFPPLLALCKAQLNVYEEAAAYSYICGVAMFLGTISFVRQPRFRLYLILSFCGGLLPFIRPTIGIYGFASLLIAWCVSRRAGWAWWKSFAGPALFSVGILSLLWTNQQRFGSMLEFGHKLNLSATNCEFLSQFYNPYGKEPLWSAARELVGTMFFTPTLNGFNAFRDNAVHWQSPTIRYRAIYHTLYDWTFLLGILVCWAFVLRQALLWRRTRAWRPQDVMAMTAGVWSLLAFIPLFAFYLRFDMIFSRYLFDFAPAIGVAMFGAASALWTISKESSSRWLRSFTPAFLVPWCGVLWWGFETATIHANAYGQTQSQAMVLQSLQRYQASGLPSLPSHYAAGQDLPELYRIPYNGEGWLPTGEVRCVVTLFVHDLNRLSLEISSAAVSDGDCALIRARIGEEFLRIESIQTTDRGKRITFASPTSEIYRKGIQIVFVAFATPTTYRREDPPFKLLEVNWTQSGLE